MMAAVGERKYPEASEAPRPPSPLSIQPGQDLSAAAAPTDHPKAENRTNRVANVAWGAWSLIGSLLSPADATRIGPDILGGVKRKATKAAVSHTIDQTESVAHRLLHAKGDQSGRTLVQFGIGLDKAFASPEGLREVADDVRSELGIQPRYQRQPSSPAGGAAAQPDVVIETPDREKDISQSQQQQQQLPQENPPVPQQLPAAQPQGAGIFERMAIAINVLRGKSDHPYLAQPRQGKSLWQRALEMGLMVGGGGAALDFAHYLKRGIEVNGVPLPQYQAEHAFLMRLIPLIEHAQESHSLNEVIQFVREQKGQLWFAGVQMAGWAKESLPPKSGEDGYDQMAALFQEEFRQADRANYKERIENQKELFIQNTSRLAVFLAVDSYFKLGFDNDFYFGLIKEARDNAEKGERILKREFFKRIDGSNLSGPSKLFAKCFYRLAAFFIPLVTDITAEKTINFISNLIAEKSKDKFDQIGNETLLNLKDYLADLRRCFKRVAKSDTGSGRLDLRIAKELQNPRNNSGFTQEELHDAVARTLIKQFVPSVSTILFDSVVKRAMKNPTLAKYLLVPLAYVAGSCLWILFLPLSTVIRWKLPEMVVKARVVDKILNSSLKSINNNGYTHAVNKIILQRLRKIWDLMNIQGTQHEGFDRRIKEISRTERKEYAALVKDLFNVLDLSKCDNEKEVEQFFKKPTLLQQVKQALDEAGVEDVVQTATELLYLAWDSIKDREEIEAFTCLFMESVNDAYNEGKAVARSDYRAVEEEIRVIKDKITIAAIRKAIEEKFQSPAEKRKKLGAEYAEKIQQQIHELADEQGKLAQALAEAVENNNFLGTRENLMRIRGNLRQHIGTIMGRKEDARGDRDFTTGLQGPLFELEDQLLRFTKKLTDTVVDLNSRMAVKGEPQIFKLYDHLVALEQAYSNPKISARDLDRMGSHLACLRAPFIAQGELSTEFSQTAASIEEIKKIQDFRSRLSEIEKLFLKLEQEKKANILKEEGIDRVERRIDSLPYSDQRELFKNSLKAFRTCHTLPSLEEWKQSFSQQLRDSRESATERVQEHKEVLIAFKIAVQGSLQKRGLSLPEDAKTATNRTVETIRTTLQELLVWKQTVKPPEILNFPLNIDPVKDGLMEIGWRIVKSRVDGIFDFVSKPYNYKGLADRIILLPVLAKFGVKAKQAPTA